MTTLETKLREILRTNETIDSFLDKTEENEIISQLLSLIQEREEESWRKQRTIAFEYVLTLIDRHKDLNKVEKKVIKEIEELTHPLV